MQLWTVLLATTVLAGVSEGGLKRMKRQDWNFPGGVDSGSNSGSNVVLNRQTTRPTQRPVPTPTTQEPGSVTLPESGIIFAAPCSRCMTTFQYNPVCGSDTRTYANIGILDCSRMCGINVQLGRLGVCQTPR